MSLARQFLREFRPLFRMLEEPLGRAPGYAGLPMRSFFDDPFFNSPTHARPAIDVSEEGNQYVVEAELPGVKKDNVEVRIGDGGRSVTIEGKIVRRSSAPQTEEGSTAATSTEGNPTRPPLVSAARPAGANRLTAAAAVAKPDETSNQLSVERTFTGSSSFTRTVWLPRPVDPNKVSAKLTDGILTVRIPKAEEVGTVKVDVD
ncbi:hypothetical protein HETIRDRAFT_409448 [Heterobasidion irregulare TC 32-1]|uniref:SHSP domain-containing protein n=1 Tax=Heterobasidion irregulare (strain TC 32-1) TaxID=747525 RepID=W4K911_HETIT|nr:uncharacterized protein HETIRDRAFT_409448 [Heterobasidion irregulare TC 32-1]ETW81571.1 hypothetical protein HETIRDRAFT_409448 [Heterobasidion irregulare TC 32-1]